MPRTTTPLCTLTKGLPIATALSILALAAVTPAAAQGPAPRPPAEARGEPVRPVPKAGPTAPDARGPARPSDDDEGDDRRAGPRGTMPDNPGCPAYQRDLELIV
jgi:hypothetical protein